MRLLCLQGCLKWVHTTENNGFFHGKGEKNPFGIFFMHLVIIKFKICTFLANKVQCNFVRWVAHHTRNKTITRNFTLQTQWFRSLSFKSTLSSYWPVSGRQMNHGALLIKPQLPFQSLKTKNPMFKKKCL